MTAGNRENVAIFNPLVLPLPNWHPDGPDGNVDGFVIPFVFPDDRASGRQPNRGARIRVYPTPRGWRAALLNCQDHAETAEQARAFAAAWIRAAEVLDNVGASSTGVKPAGDEGQDGTCRDCGNVGAHHQQCPTQQGEELTDVDRDPWAVRPFSKGDRVRVTDRMSGNHDRIGTVTGNNLDGDVEVALEADRGRPAYTTGFHARHLKWVNR